MPNYVKRDTWPEYEAADSWFSINAANLRDGRRRGEEKWINPVSCDINLEYIYGWIFFEKVFLSFSFRARDKIKKERDDIHRVFKKYLFWQIARINISRLARPFSPRLCLSKFHLKTWPDKKGGQKKGNVSLIAQRVKIMPRERERERERGWGGRRKGEEKRRKNGSFCFLVSSYSQRTD